ncbi:zinc metalloproteinase nas-13-like [Osmia lignaria lignaria]|uniref:zinc metalloproteinase nas-13-like n=1 Tax=Osmia lignaria lignaria TaxID=1437193 RepID=UPI001478D2A1|nr:zinc metalloproteinase nas-13-like isoform X1 [Osmia lignaria]
MYRTSVRVLLIFPFISLTSTRLFRRPEAINSEIHDINNSNGHFGHLEDFLYGLPDGKTGRRVAEWHENMTSNPEELGSYVEGDILFPMGTGRNGLRASSATWPNGVVPYIISPYFDADQRKVIYEAMNDYHKYTCIRFKPYHGVETDYIRITAGNSGCWSSVGRIGSWQNVNLQVPGCVTRKGTVIHELMHAIGFLHEQSRFERDQFVSIQWNNILNGHDSNFLKASKQTTDDFGIAYDYNSVMHYSSYAFSKNGKPTIIPRTSNDYFSEVDKYFQDNVRIKLGQREGFSKGDIQKIRRMYKCNRYG